MKELVIIGASGHGKVVADIAKQNGYESIVFLDDNDSVKECGGFPVVGKSNHYDSYDADIIVAIGNTKIRKKLLNNIESAGKNIPVLIHPKAVVAERTVIEKGTVIMAGAVVNSDVVIGKGCIINTCASVDHDCKIGNFVHISVGVHLGGTVSIDENTWVGIGATVSNNINITNDCMIGAGAVVVKDINEQGVYIGVPAKRKED